MGRGRPNFPAGWVFRRAHDCENSRRAISLFSTHCQNAERVSVAVRISVVIGATNASDSGLVLMGRNPALKTVVVSRCFVPFNPFSRSNT